MRRQIEVYAEWTDHPPDKPAWTCGSGLLLGGQLVLTTAHVVCPAGRPLATVRIRDESGLAAAKVEWHRWVDELDVALLVVTEPGWHPPAWRHPVRWGRFVTSRAEQPCEAIGFPAVVAEPARRESHHAVGVINLGSLVKSGLYAMEVRNPPAAPTPDGSWWAGMSGAALLCQHEGHNLVVGVVTVDPKGFDSRRLITVPIAAVASDPEFRRLVTQHTGRTPVAEPVELAGIAETAVHAQSPVGLLRPDVTPTPFRPRAELDQLADWCRAEPMWAARLLVGPGGQGKTRLARELARVMSSQNWATVIVAEHARIADLSLLAELQEPTLIVVDYAEARGEQLEAIARAVARTESKVRLLLLARTGSWRTELSKSSHLRFLVGVPIDQLDPVDPGPVGRQEAWNQAVIALASRLGDLDGYRSVDWPGLAHGLIAPTLSAPRYRVILEVQINALATLLRAGPQEAAAYTDDPMDILLEHERQYWNRTAQQLGVALSEETQRCVVAYASLYGAVNRDEADRVLARIPGVRDLGEDAQASICHWLATLYQGEERYWSRPQPDRLAEHLVGTSLGQGICRRKRALEISIAEVSDDQLEQALGLLVQTLVHHPSIAGTIIAAIAHGGLRAAAAAAAVVPRAEQRQPLLEALDNYIDSAPLDDLTALMDRLPRHGLSARTMRRLARVELLRPLSEPSRDIYMPAATMSASKLAIRLGQEPPKNKISSIEVSTVRGEPPA